MHSVAWESDLQRATTALNDATMRLSKFFLRQLLLNSAFGVFIAVALWVIGIPSPIIWGALAALMRFVPFVGGFIAAIPPLLLAAAVDPEWSSLLIVAALYIVSELTMGQVVEPLVFGHGTGVSPIAVIVSTVFWTWLWGPLGLLLAMPLTVCLAVLGRHVEDLRFFEVLLGDEPALTPGQSFYHRALSGDAADATYQAELYLKDQSLITYLEDVALAGLRLAQHDAQRGLLDDEQAGRVSDTVEEMLDNLADFEPTRWFSRLRPKVEKEEETPGGLASLDVGEDGGDDTGVEPVIERAELAPGWQVDEPILCIGGRTALDEAAATMLAEVLKKRGLGAKALGPETTSAAHIATLATTEAKLVCLSYLGVGTGSALIRYLVKRLRRILPEGSFIVVAYWADKFNTESVKELRATAEADAYATSLQEAVEICVTAAKGELKREQPRGADGPAPPASMRESVKLIASDNLDQLALDNPDQAERLDTEESILQVINPPSEAVEPSAEAPQKPRRKPDRSKAPVH